MIEEADSEDVELLKRMLVREMTRGVNRGHEVLVSEIVCKIMVAAHLMGREYRELCEWIVETAPTEDYGSVTAELIATELSVREAFDEAGFPTGESL